MDVNVWTTELDVGHAPKPVMEPNPPAVSIVGNDEPHAPQEEQEVREDRDEER